MAVSYTCGGENVHSHAAKLKQNYDLRYPNYFLKDVKSKDVKLMKDVKQQQDFTPIQVAVNQGKIMTPKELRKQADKIEKQERLRKKEAKLAAKREKEAERRQLIAIKALERVANDKKKGYAAVEAAKVLLENPYAG